MKMKNILLFKQKVTHLNLHYRMPNIFVKALVMILDFVKKNGNIQELLVLI